MRLMNFFASIELKSAEHFKLIEGVKPLDDVDVHCDLHENTLLITFANLVTDDFVQQVNEFFQSEQLQSAMAAPFIWTYYDSQQPGVISKNVVALNEADRAVLEQQMLRNDLSEIKSKLSACQRRSDDIFASSPLGNVKEWKITVTKNMLFKKTITVMASNQFEAERQALHMARSNMEDFETVSAIEYETTIGSKEGGLQKVSSFAITDDQQVQIEFDCADWFSKASDDDLISLYYKRWRAAEVTGQVVEWYRNKNKLVTDLFDYLEKSRLQGNHLGFVCTINKEEAVFWLLQNRVDVWSRIVCAENNVDVFSAMNGTKWYWKSGAIHSAEKCSPFNSIGEAALHATSYLKLTFPT